MKRVSLLKIKNIKDTITPRFIESGLDLSRLFKTIQQNDDSQIEKDGRHKTYRRMSKAREIFVSEPNCLHSISKITYSTLPVTPMMVQKCY